MAGTSTQSSDYSFPSDAPAVWLLLALPRSVRSCRYMRWAHATLAATVERAINEADRIGLREAGAPVDEYSPEIGTILLRLATRSNLAKWSV